MRRCCVTVAGRSLRARPDDGGMTDPEQLLDLAERARTGDGDAAEQLIAALYPVVRKHLLFTLGRSSWAEEALQESMLEIFRSLHSFRYRVSVRAWALRIASRTARSLLRKQHRLAKADILARFRQPIQRPVQLRNVSP